MPRPISLDLSFSALSHNLDVVVHGLDKGSACADVRRPKTWAVIKANAYGHGIEPAVRALQRADGLAMLDLDEAVRAREAGWQGPILLLEGFFEPRDLAVVDEHSLTPTLHCWDQFDMLEHARLRQPLNAYVKLNCGMNRLGFMPGEYARAWARARALHDAGRLTDIGKMTHFSSADEDTPLTHAQRALFLETTQDFPGPVSMCNSAATLDNIWAVPGLLEEQWVRPGVCLYGGSPFAHASAQSMGLRPVQTLRSRLLATRRVEAGDAIGYGGAFIAPEPLLTGVVACGYADGYPRHAPSGTPVHVEGVATRLLGRISMDMLVVDLSPVPHARPGASVVLWGEGGPSIDDVARAAGTIGYELMCAVAARVPRRVS